MSFFNVNYNFMHTNHGYFNHYNKTHGHHYHKDERIMHKTDYYETRTYDKKEEYDEDDTKFSMKDLAQLLNGLVELLKSLVDAKKDETSEKQEIDNTNTTTNTNTIANKINTANLSNNPFIKQTSNTEDDSANNAENQNKKTNEDVGINPYQVKVSVNGGDKTITYPAKAPDGSNYANGKKLSQIPSKNVQYDSNNKIISEDKIYYTYESDSKDLSDGRPVKHNVHFGYQYDDNGNLTKRTIERPFNGGGGETVEETYDSNNQNIITYRKETQTFSNGETHSYIYKRNEDGTYTVTTIKTNSNGETTTSTRTLHADNPEERGFIPKASDYDYI